MTQRKSLYIVTSSLPETAHHILSEKLSLLFGNFEVVRVDPFDLRASQQFVEEHLGVLSMGGTLRNFLIDFTGGQPLYLNILLRELVNLSIIHRQTEVFSPLLTQAIENTIFDQWGVLSRHFELTLDSMCGAKGNRVGASILVAFANHKYQIKELSKHLEIKQAQLTQRINRLMENGILVKSGSYFYLKDKLFRYWLKYVFHPKLKTIDSTSDRLRQEFNQEVSQAIDYFKLNAEKDFSSRIVELLHCFDNDAFQINGRKYKLPTFQQIEPLKVDKDGMGHLDVIRANCSEGTWLIVFTQQALEESDVHVFLSQSEKMREKPLRHVIISLSDLEPNAKLKALQERAWIWNESEINTFLNFYDKPFIMP